ncbi:MAG: hypothetical protein E2O59_05745 [Gammaproteobacteria bacterium]|nr:MAG: hypothetical protein E2O59_05745 [Gammaproteobacteria bacterium]
MNAKPPRLAEIILTSFITDKRMADSVLGDLAEEWQERTSRRGCAAARIWYWRQCVRSAPYLVAEWWRSASAGELARKVSSSLVVFGLVGLACLYAHLASIAIADFIIGMLSASSEGGDPLVKNWDSIARLAVVQSTGWGLLGGFGLALVVRNARMVGVVLLASLWFPATAMLMAVLPAQWPAWALIAFPVLLAGASIVGGLAATSLRGLFSKRYDSTGNP